MPANSIKRPTFDVQYDDGTDSYHVMRDLTEIFICKVSELKKLGAPIHQDAKPAFGRIILGPSFERASKNTNDLKTMIELALLDVAGPKAKKDHQVEFDTLVRTV
ncbi:MAG: hypothetical protein KA155_09750 [Alphaproteobacteria bacterium]|jgi:hypothetical protein|nr:hypothetical protein [Alphaproteobacteria bacterium]